MSKFDYKDYIKRNKFMIGNLKRYQTRTLLSENLLTEATRSQVGIIDKSGNITSTYVHYDGYPKGVGQTLKKHFNGSKTKQLLKTAGKDGVSVLGKDIKGSSDHTFQNPIKGQTLFYGRDRGDRGGDMQARGQVDKLRDYITNVEARHGAEYVYLYDERDKKWYYVDIGRSRTDLIPL